MNQIENFTYKIVMLEGKLTPLCTYLHSYGQQCLWASALSKNWRKIINNFWEKPAKLQPFISGFWGRGLIRFDWSWEVKVFCVSFLKIRVSASKGKKKTFDIPISNYILTSETHTNCPVCVNLAQQIVWGLCWN